MNDKELENVARRKAFIECGKPAGFDTGWNAGADWVERNSQAHTAETLDSMASVGSEKVNAVIKDLQDETGLVVRALVEGNPSIGTTEIVLIIGTR